MVLAIVGEQDRLSFNIIQALKTIVQKWTVFVNTKQLQHSDTFYHQNKVVGG